MSKLKLSILSAFLLLGVIPEVLRFGAIASSVGSNNSSSSGATHLAQAKPPAPRSNDVRILPNGGYEVRLGGTSKVTLPDGEIVEPDGTTTTPNGLRFRPVIGDRKVIGVQLFKPSGEKLRPGEKLILRDGTEVQQPSFERFDDDNDDSDDD